MGYLLFIIYEISIYDRKITSVPLKLGQIKN